MQKRGQITLFILLGIILLCIIALSIFIFTNISLETIDQQIYQEPQTPLQRFVASCLDKVSKDGLFRLGQQGGYVYLSEELQSNAALTIPTGINNPIKTPLWSWQGSEFIPPTELMVEQMEQYIDANIQQCLGNFTSLQDNDIRILSDPQTTVRLAKEQVFVELAYTISNDVDDRSGVTEEFGIIIPFSLEGVMQTAQKVHQALLSQQFLSQLTLDLMASADPDIPMTGIQFQCNQPKWNTYDVQERLEGILEYNIPRIRVRDTAHHPFLHEDKVYNKYGDLSMKQFEDQFCTADGCTRPKDWPRDQFEYNNMYLDADLDRDIMERGINVGFRFTPNSGLRMSATPSEDGVMYGSLQENNNDYLDFFCMHVYHFTYDVLYPAEVVIVQNEAFDDGSPFVLRFGVPVALENNIPTERLGAGALLFPTRYNEDFCRNDQGEEVQIYTINSFTGQRVGDVNLSYECLKYRCPLGTTRSELNGIQRLSATLSQSCHAGFIVAEHPGYVKQKAQYTPGIQTVEMQLLPVRPIYYRVDLAKKGTAPVPLRDGQSAYVSVESKEYNYKESFTYDPLSDNYLELLETSTIYDVSVMVFDENTIIGGYEGAYEISPQNAILNLHVYEELPHPVTAQQVQELFEFLREDDEYQQDYGLSWS